VKEAIAVLRAISCICQYITADAVAAAAAAAAVLAVHIISFIDVTTTTLCGTRGTCRPNNVVLLCSIH